MRSNQTGKSLNNRLKNQKRFGEKGYQNPPVFYVWIVKGEYIMRDTRPTDDTKYQTFFSEEERADFILRNERTRTSRRENFDKALRFNSEQNNLEP